MRLLPLIFAAVLVLLAADAALAAPSQAPPNTNGGSGSVPAAPTPTPVDPPARTATPSATQAPAAPAAPVAPAPTPKRRAAPGLSATVRRLRGCLPDVTRREGRVLVLRSGLGRSKPTSRARIARALDLSAPAVARAERSGLRRLRASARARECEKSEDRARDVVRGAAAAFRAGNGGNGTSSNGESGGSAVAADPERPAATTVSGPDGGNTGFLFALVAGALGLALIARGVLKESRN